MNEAYTSSLSIKEERIAGLESRLKESRDRNMQLQEQMRGLRQSYEALQQRREEEALQTSTPPKHRSVASLVGSLQALISGSFSGLVYFS